MDIVESLKRIRKMAPLLRKLTVRDIIFSGDDAVIDASGLNPYCIKEGLADGDEPALSWTLDALIDDLDKGIAAIDHGGTWFRQSEATPPINHPVLVSRGEGTPTRIAALRNIDDPWDAEPQNCKYYASADCDKEIVVNFWRFLPEAPAWNG